MKGLSSAAMTYIGLAAAALGFIVPQLPDDTPAWVRLILGATLATVSAALGKTHPGTKRPKT